MEPSGVPSWPQGMSSGWGKSKRHRRQAVFFKKKMLLPDVRKIWKQIASLILSRTLIGVGVGDLRAQLKSGSFTEMLAQGCYWAFASERWERKGCTETSSPEAGLPYTPWCPGQSWKKASFSVTTPVYLCYTLTSLPWAQGKELSQVWQFKVFMTLLTFTFIQQQLVQGIE
jgi:hypothetical protein